MFPSVKWGKVRDIDKVALGKAFGVLAMSWLALPLLYFMFKKKEVTEENDREKQPEQALLEVL